jgi:hypothetical protein
MTIHIHMHQANSFRATLGCCAPPILGDSAFRFIPATPLFPSSGFPSISSGGSARGRNSATGFGNRAGGVGFGASVKKRCCDAWHQRARYLIHLSRGQSFFRVKLHESLCKLVPLCANGTNVISPGRLCPRRHLVIIWQTGMAL